MKVKKKLKDYSVLIAYFFVPFNPKTFCAFWSLLRTIAKDFFALQFLKKFGFLKTPIVKVDHALDNKIPFCKNKVGIYLDFVNFWIRPLSFLIKNLGKKKSTRWIKKWFYDLKNCYIQAARVYRFRFTTMRRPKCPCDFRFFVIHTFDPHLLCVPSLHIAICILTFSFYRQLFEQENFSPEQKRCLFCELYENAVAIAESVLLIKQHSVNCIPAALYMMTKIFPELFSPIDAVEFINQLFKNNQNLLPNDRAQILRHITFLYERFLLEGHQEDDWRTPIFRFLLQIQPSA